MSSTSLWARITRNTDWSTWPLARPFARSFVLLTRLLALDYSLCSRPPLRSLLCSLRSLPRSWESEFLMCQNDLVLSHSGVVFVVGVSDGAIINMGLFLILLPVCLKKAEFAHSRLSTQSIGFWVSHGTYQQTRIFFRFKNCVGSISEKSLQRFVAGRMISWPLKIDWPEIFCRNRLVMAKSAKGISINAAVLIDRYG